MQASIVMPFLIRISEHDMSDDVHIEVISKYLKYLLGLSKYNTTVTFFKKLNLAKEFRDSLFEFNEDKIKYIKIYFRKAARGEEVVIHDVDRYWLNTIDVEDYNIKVLKYPTSVEILKSMELPIKNSMGKLYNSTNTKFKNLFPYEELISLMNLKILKTYRLYIHGYKTVLDKNAFYKILHNSIKASKIDLIRKSQSLKRGVFLVSLTDDSFEGVYLQDKKHESVINNNLNIQNKWSPSPEHSLMFKEQINRLPISNFIKQNLLIDDISEEDETWI